MMIQRIPADRKDAVIFSENETEYSAKAGWASISVPSGTFQGKGTVECKSTPRHVCCCCVLVLFCFLVPIILPYFCVRAYETCETTGTFNKRENYKRSKLEKDCTSL